MASASVDNTEWKFFDDLLRLSQANASAHALLKLWEHNDVAFDEWARTAILFLVAENESLREIALNFAKSAAPGMVILQEKI